MKPRITLSHNRYRLKDAPEEHHAALILFGGWKPVAGGLATNRSGGAHAAAKYYGTQIETTATGRHYTPWLWRTRNIAHSRGSYT